MPFRILIIIPARCGSKGLQDKNIREVAGKSLLTRAIELAQKSQHEEEDWSIMVSTNSSQYAQIAINAGALVPQLRPENLAQDTTPLTKVIFHSLSLMESIKGIFDCVMMITPTTPLTLPADVRQAIEIFKSRNLPSLVAVTPIQIPPSWVFSIENGLLSQKETQRIQRRQTEETSYKLNGALYLAQPQWLRENGQFFKSGHTCPYIMPASRSLDIENEDDLQLAELLLTHQNREQDL